MSQEPPERPGTANFVTALSVPRNARVGVVVGVAIALFFVYGAVTGPQGQYSPVAYVGLGFVLAVGVALLVTLLLTLGSAYRLSREL